MVPSLIDPYVKLAMLDKLSFGLNYRKGRKRTKKTWHPKNDQNLVETYIIPKPRKRKNVVKIKSPSVPVNDDDNSQLSVLSMLRN